MYKKIHQARNRVPHLINVKFNPVPFTTHLLLKWSRTLDLNLLIHFDIMYLLFPFIFDICSEFYNYIRNSNLNLMLFHWLHLLLQFLLEVFPISKFFVMINFLVHWSTYSVFFFRKGTLTICFLKPYASNIVFPLSFHMKANVAGLEFW